MNLYQRQKEWAKTGKIPCSGLCATLSTVNVGSLEKRYEYEELFQLFIPDFYELRELVLDGYDTIYWASGLPRDHHHEIGYYTELRQYIVLLICAMADDFNKKSKKNEKNNRKRLVTYDIETASPNILKWK